MHLRTEWCVFVLDSFCVCVRVCVFVCVCVAGGFVLTIAFVLNWLAKQWRKIWTVIMQQYLETSQKSNGAAFSPSFLLSLSPSSTSPPPSFSRVALLSADLCCISHCRTPRKAQTASDKVRTVHVLFSVGSELINAVVFRTIAIFFQCEGKNWDYLNESETKMSSKEKRSELLFFFSKHILCSWRGRSIETCQRWQSTSEVCRSSLQYTVTFPE